MNLTPLAQTAPVLRRALGYRKFSRDRVKVVVLDSGYHLQHECAHSLRAMGHIVKSVYFRPNTAFQEILQELLTTISGFKPDFLLTINHLGFDREGALGALLEQVQLPIAAWYVDSPFFVRRGTSIGAQSMTSTFVWDEAYIPALTRAGAQDVHYLPLAADTRILEQPQDAIHQRYPLLFVGDSMQQANIKWQGRVPSTRRAFCSQLEKDLICDRAHFSQVLKGSQDYCVADWDCFTLATFRATGKYRKSILTAFPRADLHIIGDMGWTDVLPGASLHPAVAYGPDLAKAFQSATINVNATSLQMPSAVNQRVFDVPAAGAFLLTDAQSDLARHFTLPTGLRFYQTPQEAGELAHYYASSPAVRDRITIDLREQILERHTYVHRLRDLVLCMRQRHRCHAAAHMEAI